MSGLASGEGSQETDFQRQGFGGVRFERLAEALKRVKAGADAENPE